VRHVEAEEESEEKSNVKNHEAQANTKPLQLAASVD
jgi:hypothetical protein